MTGRCGHVADARETMTVRSDHARWRAVSGDLAGDAAEKTELLADRIRVLGPQHRDTVTNRQVLELLAERQAES